MKIRRENTPLLLMQQRDQKEEWKAEDDAIAKRINQKNHRKAKTRRSTKKRKAGKLNELFFSLQQIVPNLKRNKDSEKKKQKNKQKQEEKTMSEEVHMSKEIRKKMKQRRMKEQKMMKTRRRKKQRQRAGDCTRRKRRRRQQQHKQHGDLLL